MPTRRHLLAAGAASLVVPGIVRSARANPWPDRTVHMVVPLAAGGPTDVNARVVAEQLGKIWGQQIVIDNKAGAGTNIGNAFVAHSEADGYTLLYGTSSLASNGALYRSLDYSPLTDLRPVSLVARFPFFMFVPNSFPAKTVAQFIDYVKAQPGKLIMASRSGQVSVLASTGAKRSPAEPDVPTIAESGLPGYVVDSWQGVFAPAKTPSEIVQKTSRDLAKALAEPSLIEKLGRNAYRVESSSPDELAKFLNADMEKWEALIKTVGIRID
jgi:tripartite-type tricarboxylate transporter receptor subunit TctC